VLDYVVQNPVLDSRVIPNSTTHVDSRMKKYRAFLIIGIVLLAALAATAWLLRPRWKEDSFIAANSNSQAVTAPPSKSKAPADAVVTLEEFGDYQCPLCGTLHPGLKQLKHDFGPNLNFVFRNFPLPTIHKNAMAAAQAAEAARMQDRFWEMHDLLYENQDLWKEDVNPRAIFLTFAGDLGLDKNRFTRDMDSDQVKLRIQADQSAATELGINGTPTVLIEGRELRPEVTNLVGIRKGIEFYLAKKVSATP
jgi:protein-disulfide isomerase